MDEGHKFLALKNAVNLLYNNSNFITAGHLARQIISLANWSKSKLALPL